MRSVLVFALLLLSPLAASAGWQSYNKKPAARRCGLTPGAAIRR
jgi:hypothetical protein